MTVLVTGATGLIGRPLTERLDALGIRCATTSRRRSERAGHFIADLTIRGDVSDLLRSCQPEIIVHLAGGSGAGVEEMYLSNVVSTMHLIEEAPSVGLNPRFLIVGSAAEYGDAGSDLIGPDTPLAPATAYGRAKAAQTTIGGALCDRLGLDYSIIRPFNIYSSTTPPPGALGDIGRQMLAQSGPVRRVECGRLDIIRDYLPLDVVVEALAAAIERRPSERVLNVCSGIAIMVGDVVDAMGIQLGVSLDLAQVERLVSLPAPLVSVGDGAPLTAFLGRAVAVSAADVAADTLAGLQVPDPS